MKDRIDVSPEMVTFVGVGEIDARDLPPRAVMFLFHRDAARSVTMSVHRAFVPDAAGDASLVFVVDGAACARLFPEWSPAIGRWHLDAALVRLVEGIERAEASAASLETLRLGRSIDLLCSLGTALSRGDLLPADGSGTLSAHETARIVAARRVVDERWAERLTLDTIARTCGINRALLTRGFRQIYDCTVGDVLAGNRLEAAHGLLLRTDLPVASIGYRCGYRNNASFTRAFTRRFGQSPSGLRRAAA